MRLIGKEAMPSTLVRWLREREALSYYTGSEISNALLFLQAVLGH